MHERSIELDPTLLDTGASLSNFLLCAQFRGAKNSLLVSFKSHCATFSFGETISFLSLDLHAVIMPFPNSEFISPLTPAKFPVQPSSSRILPERANGGGLDMQILSLRQ